MVTEEDDEHDQVYECDCGYEAFFDGECSFCESYLIFLEIEVGIVFQEEGFSQDGVVVKGLLDV